MSKSFETRVVPLTETQGRRSEPFYDKVERCHISKHVSMENDKYMVTYYYSQALIAGIINFGHLFIGPISIPILQLIFGKYLLEAMLLDFSKKYFQGDFIHWL